LSPTAGTNLGYKHTIESRLNMSGDLHYSRRSKDYLLSPEFTHMQFRDKKGMNNPMFGIVKSEATIKKLIKLVYVYEAENLHFLGSFSTVQCSKHFKIGKDTLRKYLKSNIPYKGKLFSRVPLN
jgi:hypothetical protein